MVKSAASLVSSLSGLLSQEKTDGESKELLEGLIHLIQGSPDLRIVVGLIKSASVLTLDSNENIIASPPPTPSCDLPDAPPSLVVSPPPPAAASAASPPPPAAAAAASPPPPPPPPPPPSFLQAPLPPPPPQCAAGPCLPPPPPPPASLLRPAQPVELPAAMLPKATPPEGSKMRPLQWAKIPVAKVASSSLSSTNNIWMRATCSKNNVSVDYSELDSLFRIADSNTNGGGGTSSAERERRANQMSSARKESVNLLCSRRSLQANIFLKQIKDPAALVEDIREGRGAFSKEILAGLAAVLPDKEQAAVLRGYTGDASLLAPPEQFFLSLIDVPDYTLRLDCLLFRRHFHSSMEEIAPLLACLRTAIQELLDSRSLGRLLLTIVRVGNYLNHGNTQGMAAAFKLNSLWKVADVRASRARDAAPSLLHYLAELDSTCVRDLEKELPALSSAAKISVEFVKSEVEMMQSRRRNLCERLAKKDETELFFAAEREYLEDHCRGEMEEVEEQLKRLIEDEKRLRCHFCDDSLKTEETLKIVAHFVSRLSVAAKENESRATRAAASAAAAAVSAVHASHSEPSLENKSNGKVLRRSRTFVQQPTTEEEETGEGGQPTLECLLLRENRSTLTSTRRRQSSILPQSSTGSANLEDLLSTMETERNPKIIRRRSTIRQQPSTDLPPTAHENPIDEEPKEEAAPSSSSAAIHLEVLDSNSGGDSSSSVSPKSSDEGFDSDPKEALVATNSPTAKAETPSRPSPPPDETPAPPPDDAVTPPPSSAPPPAVAPPTPVPAGRPVRKTVSITTSPTTVAKVRRPTTATNKTPSPPLARTPSKLPSPSARSSLAAATPRTPETRPRGSGFSASRLTSPGMARRPASQQLQPQPGVRQPAASPSVQPVQLKPVPARVSPPPPISSSSLPSGQSRTPQPVRARTTAAPRRSVPLTDDEKKLATKSLNARAMPSVSTASRPALVKTTTAAAKASMIKNDVIERPKPLRQTTAKPKWV